MREMSDTMVNNEDFDMEFSYDRTIENVKFFY